MRVHQLKVVNPYFYQIKTGVKTFEIRKNDRDFNVGDRLLLNEYDKDTDSYTGDYIVVNVSHIMFGGVYGLDLDYCIMSITIKPINQI